MITQFHKTLNPKLWQPDNSMRTEVAAKLKEIAKAFIEFMGINKEAVTDIVVTGSSASYNYTPQSDIDLHILVDFDKVHKDCPIVGDLLLSKKSEFNNNHDIFIYDIPVEVYAEAEDNENVHNGLYSLKSGKWVDEPQKLKPLDNDVAVKAKYKELAGAIKEVADKEEAEQLIDKIKRMRKAGLAKEGEFSVENLVFKKLRNEGLIGKLMDIKKEGIDKELSLEETYENIIGAIEEMICTSTAVMAPYPVDVVGRPAPFKKGKSKKSHGEKRAPHTKVYEELEKQSKGSQKKAMLGYKYKKSWNNTVVEAMEGIANTCEAILTESVGDKIKSELLPKVKADIANLKAERRNVQKTEKEAQRQLHKVEKDPQAKSYPIKSMMLKDKISQNRKARYAAEDKVKELADKRDKLEG